MAIPIPPIASPHIPKANALEWRGFAERKLCSHISNLHGNFFPLATDGERCIVETFNGQVLMTQLSAIIWPKSAGTVMQLRKPKADKKKAKLKKLLAQLGLEESDITELTNL